MRSLAFVVSLAVTFSLLSGGAAAYDDKAARNPGSADALGPVHQALARMAGDYDTVSSFRQQPDAKPVVSKGTAKLTAVVDGHFLLEETSSTLFGQPVKGLRLLGYNGKTNRYEATWTYSMATGMMGMTGTSNDGGKTIEWTETDPSGRGANSSLHVTTRHLDDNRFTVELYNLTPNGKRGTTIETTYTRSKK
jgi:hypothetical protein